METTLIKRIFGYLPGTIIPAILTLISLKFFSIHLSIEEFGLYNYWLTLSILISSVFSQWISQPILRYTTDKKIVYQENVVSFAMIIIIMLVVITLFFEYFFINNEDYKLYSLITILIFCLTYIQIIYSKLQVNFEIRKYSIVKFSESIAKVIFPIIGVSLFVPNTNIIFIFMVIGMFFIIVITYKILFPIFIFNYKKLDSKVFLNTSKMYFKFGAPMVLWFSINGIMSFTDRFLLKNFSGYDSVAIYSANYSLITGSVALITSPLLLIAHPLLMNKWNKKKHEETGNILSYFIEIFILLSFLLISLTYINKDLITIIFLNDKFTQGNVVMPLILVGFIIWQLGMLFHKPIEFSEDTKKIVFAMIIACSINVSLNVILIPKISYIGAAIASIISYTSYSFIVYKWGNKIIKFEVFSEKILINILLLTLFLFLKTIESYISFKNLNEYFSSLLISFAYIIAYLRINFDRLVILFKIIK